MLKLNEKAISGKIVGEAYIFYDEKEKRLLIIADSDLEDIHHDTLTIDVKIVDSKGVSWFTVKDDKG